MSERAAFVADFSDGYTLRNIFEYLRNTNTVGIFTFSESAIVYEPAADAKIINVIHIATSDLASYKFSSSSPVSIGVNLSDILSIIKTIGKKDGIRFYKLSDDPFLYIQIISQNLPSSDRDNISIIRPQQLQRADFVEPRFSRPETSPNAVISSQRFVKICKAIASLKNEHVSIVGYPEGIVIVSLTHGIMFGRIEKIGQVPEEPIDLERTSQPFVKVHSSTIKSLGRIGNMHPSGNIKLFLEKDTPLKIVAKVGTFGTLRTFIYSQVE